MYFVGIDIAKYKHDCFITDENGLVIYKLEKDNILFDNKLLR